MKSRILAALFVATAAIPVAAIAQGVPGGIAGSIDDS